MRRLSSRSSFLYNLAEPPILEGGDPLLHLSASYLVSQAQASQAADKSRTAKMKPSTSLLLQALVGAAAAVSDASVYIFQRDESPNFSSPPTLTPEQARLVFAQRLGTSRYHGLGDASESTVSYINSFGGRRESIFEDAADDKLAELVLIVEGVSSKTAQPLIDEWSSIKPAFTISKAPSMNANKKLALDLNQQCGHGKSKCALQDAINPFDVSCWNGKSKVIHFNLVKEKVRYGQNSYPVLANIFRMASRN